MIIKTKRLVIRPFETGDEGPMLRRVLGQDFGHSTVEHSTLDNLHSWLEWQRLNDEWLPRMLQPPYGDRAITLKDSGQLIGAVGYVPCLAPFAKIPELGLTGSISARSTPELGLFYAVDHEYQRRGFATEAARAMIDHAFNQLHVERVIAMTDYSNTTSQRVMQKIGMKITRNPTSEPSWLQVVGVITNQGQ